MQIAILPHSAIHFICINNLKVYFLEFAQRQSYSYITVCLCFVGRFDALTRTLGRVPSSKLLVINMFIIEHL